MAAFCAATASDLFRGGPPWRGSSQAIAIAALYCGMARVLIVSLPGTRGKIPRLRLHVFDSGGARGTFTFRVAMDLHLHRRAITYVVLLTWACGCHCVVTVVRAMHLRA